MKGEQVARFQAGHQEVIGPVSLTVFLTVFLTVSQAGRVRCRTVSCISRRIMSESSNVRIGLPQVLFICLRNILDTLSYVEVSEDVGGNADVERMGMIIM